MHAILESNCTVIKLQSNRNFKAKKQNRIQIEFSLQKLSNATKWMEALDDFYTDCPFVD